MPTTILALGLAVAARYLLRPGSTLWRVISFWLLFFVVEIYITNRYGWTLGWVVLLFLNIAIAISWISFCRLPRKL